MAFTPDYNTRIYDESTSPTYSHKKHYDENVYVVFPNNNFHIKKNSTLPVFNCFIKQNSEQFGDALPVAGTNTYLIRLYDSTGNLTLNEALSSKDDYLGEYSYTFKVLDLDTQGLLDGEIVSLDSGLNESVIGKFQINVV